RAVAGRCDVFFLVLGDQPRVKSSTYQKLIEVQKAPPSLLYAGERVGEKGKKRASARGATVRLTPPAPLPCSLPGVPGRGRAPLTQPTFNGRRGHPILLSVDAIDEILSLPSDATLKDYTRRVAAHEVGVDDPGILTDIDTPEDYDRAFH